MSSSIRSLMFVDIFLPIWRISLPDTWSVRESVNKLHIFPLQKAVLVLGESVCWSVAHRWLVTVSQVTLIVDHMYRGPRWSY